MGHALQIATYPRILPVGEAALTVEFGDRVDAALNRQVHTLDRALATCEIEGVIECVPTYRSLLVVFDPHRVAPAALQVRLLALARESRPDDEIEDERLIKIPIRYGGEDGPDLEDVAAHCRITPDEVVTLHAGATYQVAMLGFAPGFAYLLGLPGELAIPRLATPRLHVPPGSVGIAGDQTGIYALDTPGGWRIIGRTNQTLFDPARPVPFTLRAGDRIRFDAHRP
jgi:inhibitor of KinA